jgi:membrane fusion protein, heavy metal efflux system
VWSVSSLACGGPDTPGTLPEKPRSSSRASERPSPIDTVLITATPASSTLTRPAHLTYADDEFSTITSPLQGRVLEVRARMGESVKAGQILMVIDSPDIATAYSDYVKEISELSLAERNYDLASDLVKMQAIPLKEFKQAENDVHRERAEYAQAKDRLVFLGVLATELEKPLTQQHITSRFELKSPLTGTVVERNVTPGQSVGPGDDSPLLTVANLNRLQATVDVYERDVPLMRVGQVAHLTVEAYPGVDFPVTTRFIGEVVDPTTRTIQVRAVVDNTDRRLKPQMYGQVTIPVEGTAQVILIPRQALTQTGGRTLVYVEREPGHFQPRVITVQEQPGEQLRVLDGLVVGERIASHRLTTLPPG